ncbi:MAG: hypothetical protein FD146_2480 [Anaerolineaceae bacterium]|nr:MAG: hypothetical protein FD146_2480 [Anaerolineaceae bacterium]
MISIVVVLWMFIILFAIIGAMRGWAKEILVTASVIVVLALLLLLEKTLGTRELIQGLNKTLHFWLRIIILLLLVIFGYQTPHLQRLAPKMTREKMEHIILGTLIGAVNGYLIFGSILFYMADAGYPFTKVMAAPTGDIAKTIETMLIYMPPRLLGDPGIYYAVVIAFIFVIVVLI